MKRTQFFAVLMTLLAAAQTPAVFIDNFDSLSPEWQFLNVETSSNLIHDVSGGFFRARGFSSVSGGPTHTNWVRREIFDANTPGQNNLTLRTKMSLPLTQSISVVGFSIFDTDSQGNERGTREVSFSTFGNDHVVLLAAGSIFTTVTISGLVNEVDVELRNQGPVTTLFLNGTFVSTVTNNSFFHQNPSYRAIQMSFTGDEGTSAPVNVDYIQVVPEPTSLAGLGLASLIAASRARTRGRS